MLVCFDLCVCVDVHILVFGTVYVWVDLYIVYMYVYLYVCTCMLLVFRGRWLTGMWGINVHARVPHTYVLMTGSCPNLQFHWWGEVPCL